MTRSDGQERLRRKKKHHFISLGQRRPAASAPLLRPKGAFSLVRSHWPLLWGFRPAVTCTLLQSWGSRPGPGHATPSPGLCLQLLLRQPLGEQTKRKADLQCLQKFPASGESRACSCRLWVQRLQGRGLGQGLGGPESSVPILPLGVQPRPCGVHSAPHGSAKAPRSSQVLWTGGWRGTGSPQHGRPRGLRC